MPEDTGTETLHEEVGEQEEHDEGLTPDPGSLEGLPKPEPTDSKAVQKRIDKLTKKMRDYERTSEEFKKMAEEREDAVRLLQQQNAELFEVIKKRSEPQAHQTPQVDPELTMRELKKMRNEARKELDWDKVDLLDDQIDKVKDLIAEKRTAELKNEYDNKFRQAEDQKGVETIVREWTAKTEWYNPHSDKFDEIMAAAAVEYDKRLAVKPEWKNRPLMDRLNQVKKDIEKRFGMTKETRPPTVERGGTESPAPPPAAKLTEEERYVAHRMFRAMPSADAEKLYFQQKLEIERERARR